MDEPASSADGSLRGVAERLALACVGVVALSGERADELADSLAARGMLRREDARQLIEDATDRWRGDAVRLGERATTALHGILHEIGLVTREQYDELELRVAQLEHRLRLLESRADVPPTV